MKVGDLVKYEAEAAAWSDNPNTYTVTGVIIAELPSDGILNAAVSVLWASGEFVERVPHRILEVINENR
jgi:hypothetical protein